MAASIACPACAKKLLCSVPPVPGQQMRCHGCGHSFLVGNNVKRERPSPPSPEPETRPARGLIVAVAAGVALLIGVATTYLLTRERTPQTAAADPATPSGGAPENRDHLQALTPPQLEDLRLPDLDHPHLTPLAPVKLEIPSEPVPPPDPPPPPPPFPPPRPADKTPPDKTPPDKTPPDKTPPDKTPPKKDPPAAEAEFKQLQARLAWDEVELTSQLTRAPELDLSGVGDVRFAMHNNASAVDTLVNGGMPNPMAMNGVRIINGAMLKLLKDERDQGLPVRSRSILNPMEAVSLKTLSADVRTTLPANVAPGAARFTGSNLSGPARAKALSDLFTTWSSQNLEKNLDVVPTVVQMLQIEDADVRGLLVQELDRVKYPGASMALASRAAFDVSPDVRKAAIEKLRSRKPEEYRVMLLYAMRYPWAPAADHAAEALIELKDTGAVPKLIELLNSADPAKPALSLKTKKYVIPEVVRVNHLRNCYLCHAPSFSTNDPVRGAVPVPGKPLPVQYYAGSAITGGEGFVRADVSYLREDFSMSLGVKDADPWPDTQRYDYLVRIRDVSKDELQTFGIDPTKTPPGPPKSDTLYPQQEAVLFALTRLTGQNFGTDVDKWKSYLGNVKAAPKK
jgi:hypothetical protein